MKKDKMDVLSCHKGERFYFVAKIMSNTGYDLHWIPDGGYKAPENTVYNTIDRIIRASVGMHLASWQAAFFMNKFRHEDDMTQYRIYCIALMFKPAIEKAMEDENLKFDYKCVGDYFIHDVIELFRNEIVENK